MSAADLDVAMDDRRDHLRMRWAQVARSIPMDPSNLRRIRNGDVPLTKFAAAGIDTALQWPPGTAMSYYVTGKPNSPATDAGDPGINEEMLAHLHEVWAPIAAIADEAERTNLLQLLDDMWRKRERDTGRHMRTMVQFMTEIREIRAATTDRDESSEAG